MARDLLKHITPPEEPTTGDTITDPNERLNAELERYATAHNITLGSQTKLGRGFVYGTDPVVWFLPAASEIGANTRAFAEEYLKNGQKPYEHDHGTPEITEAQARALRP